MQLKINKGVGLIFLLVFGVLTIFFFFMGLNADPKALTDDGFSLKRFYFIIGTCFLILPLLIFLVIYSWVYFNNKNINYFKKNGIPGIATIVSCHSTDIELNNLHQVEMELKIQSSQNDQYTVIHREYFNPINMDKLVNRLKLNILIDPNNKKKIMVLWK